MGRVLIPAAVLYFLTAAAFPQTGLNEKEPSRSQLGAPLYPGAVYIRTISGFDPYHTTAEYVTPDDMKTVLAFFERKLPEKRMFDYQDRRTYLFGFLLKREEKPGLAHLCPAVKVLCAKGALASTGSTANEHLAASRYASV